MLKITHSSLILLLFCIFSNIGAINGGEVDKKLHENCIYPTIYVGKANDNGYGSGVIVRSEKVSNNVYKNVFITCAHITEDAAIDYEVKQYVYEDWSQVKGSRTYPAAFCGYNRDLDIGIGVFFSHELMPTAQLDFDPKIYLGNEVFRIGCGLADDPRLDYGKLTAYKKTQKSYFRTSVMTVPGDSGSPLFYNNKVIGIMISIRSYRNVPVFTISYAVPIQRFKQWSDANNGNLNFVWDSTKELPELQFRYLKFKQYEIVK